MTQQEANKSVLLRDAEKLLEMYRKMLEIRLFEERVGGLWRKGLLPGSVHLYIGQEAVAVGVCSNLRKDDYVTSTHRGHGHLLAKGGSMPKLLAELYGKKDGYCGGKGGSMHATAMDIGVVGANPIVGAGFPIAAGVGLSFKMMRTDRVCVCFFGDGASNEGAFHEGLNFASIWKLPVIFVCENNLYGVSVHVSVSTSVVDIASRAAGYQIPGEVVDGMDVCAVSDAAKEAVQRARKGLGPTLLECKTYRFEGHSRGDPAFGVYRSREEVEAWRNRDPIEKLRKHLLSSGMMTLTDDKGIRDSINFAVEEAVRFAQQSPYPDVGDALLDV
ncbi:MAG: thiamine pyrophosphate-dependent dehydrogenase E1 component subunit alpha [Candidatus Bathyarchaeia archaeon]|jgi:pyruvate dehydrogenase E1 component alpha subunit